jgi:glycosyltransferase involved in cell wall biosynthesis
MTGPITLLTTNLARGGAETQVAQLAIRLRRRGWDVGVVSLLPPSAFVTELETAGVPLYSLGMRPGRPDPLAAVRLAALLRRLRPRILHSHMFHANLLARVVRLACPVPRVIATLHSLAESSRASDAVRLRDWLYRVSDPLANVTVAVCQAVAARHLSARAVPRGKLRVIPNGVDTARFRPDAARRAAVRASLGLRDEFVWLAAGRLMWKKGYPMLLRAAALHRGGVLLIAGAGPLEERLAAEAAELGVNARFLGAREDIPDLMQAADAFLLSSVVEGLPVVLLEAAASGLPCVTTAAGGAAEAVVDGQTGFVVPVADEAAFAAAMTRLRGSDLAGLGRAAREHAVANFDGERVATRWEELYRA